LHAPSRPLGVDANPVLVELDIGEARESMHRGAAAITDHDGRLIRQWGDIDRAFYPHSALKLLWALPLLETGAAERFGLTPVEIVLSASSHLGEKRPVELVDRWLSRCGIAPEALQCGPQLPFSHQAALELSHAGRQPSALHNNNSGKHAAFLTTALHLGEPLAGYLEREHPVQQRLRATVEALSGAASVWMPGARERCGMPAYRLSLRALALAMARFGNPARLPQIRADAVRKLVSAIRADPELLVGRGRLSSAVCASTDGRVIIKGGIEGVFAGALMERGIGFALKIDDGAQRAADISLAAMLASLGELPENLTARLATTIRTHAGESIGRVRSTLFDRLEHDREKGALRLDAG
jgi:L-asparaginase II